MTVTANKQNCYLSRQSLWYLDQFQKLIDPDLSEHKLLVTPINLRSSDLGFLFSCSSLFMLLE